MSNDSITTKIMSLFVVVLMLTVVALPVINDANTETESITTTHIFGNNTLAPVEEVLATSVLGDVTPTYTATRGSFDTSTWSFTENASGDYLNVPLPTLTFVPYYAGIGQTVYLYGSEFHSYWTMTGDTMFLDYGGYSITFDADGVTGYPSVTKITATGTATTSLSLIIPYDAIYDTIGSATYGNNTLNNSSVSGSYGTMSGTTFTADASGDYLQIPLYVLDNGSGTYKVEEGATIYAPDTSGSLAAFTVTNGAVTGVNTAITMTFTQDTSITSATAYTMTVTATDTDLPGIIIPKAITGTTTTPLTNVEDAWHFSRGSNETFSFIKTSTGDLYFAGKNTGYVSGLPNVAEGAIVEHWTLTATGVDKFDTDSANAAYSTSDGRIYLTGTSSLTQGTQWTLYITDSDAPLKQLSVQGGGLGYIDSNNNLRITGTEIVGSLSEDIPNVSKFVKDRLVQYYISQGNLYWRGSGSLSGTQSTPSWTNWVQETTTNDVVDAWVAYGPTGVGMYVTSSGDWYAVNKWIDASGSAVIYSTWTQIATGLVPTNTMHGPTQYTYTWFVTTDGVNTYATKSTSGSMNTFTQILEGPMTGITFTTFDPIAISVNGKVFYEGFQFPGTSSASTWTEDTRISNVKKIVGNGADVKDFIAIKNDGTAWGIGQNTNHDLGLDSSTTSWVSLGAATTTTLYTNLTESVSISDTRGTWANGTFTPDASGTSMLIPLRNAVQYTYYIGDDVVYRGPDSADAYKAFLAPDTTGLNTALTLTFTDQGATYNNTLNALTTAATDTDLKGLIIPYTATYTTYTPTHYDYNWYGNSTTFEFTESLTGDYIKVPGLVLADSNTYHLDNASTYYALDSSDDLVAFTTPSTTGVSGISLTFTQDGSIYDLMGSGNGYVIIPLVYDTDKENTIDSVTLEFVPERGNLSGGTWTPSASGTLVRVPSACLSANTYYIANGTDYYVFDGSTIGNAITTPSTTGVPEGVTIVFTENSTDDHVLDIGITAMNDTQGMIVPYEVSYTTTETVTHEISPLIGVIGILLCVVVLMFAVRLLKGDA